MEQKLNILTLKFSSNNKDNIEQNRIEISFIVPQWEDINKNKKLRI